MAKVFTTDNFKADVLETKGKVLVDFWAPWCAPCRELGPTIEELATELEGTVLVGKLDIDENPDTAAEYGVMTIPTVVIFKDGEEVERIVGGHPKEDYLDLLK